MLDLLILWDGIIAAGELRTTLTLLLVLAARGEAK
jgi:hypothetical protein